MYSNIDVTCLVPAHITVDASSTNDKKEDLEERCGICKTAVNVEEAKTIGISTPINSALCSLIKTAETTTPPRNVSANDIMADIKKRR